MARNAIAYDEDFFAWTKEQARLLRSGELVEIDAHNLAEEIESVGLSDRREIRSRMIVLLAHLLKWAFQPEARSSGWLGTIREQQTRIELVLEDSPSLRGTVPDAVAYAYPKAIKAAANETSLSESTFPPECPFTPEQVLAEDFLPEG
jgi:hypothetical protein